MKNSDRTIERRHGRIRRAEIVDDERVGKAAKRGLSLLIGLSFSVPVASKSASSTRTPTIKSAENGDAAGKYAAGNPADAPPPIKIFKKK